MIYIEIQDFVEIAKGAVGQVSVSQFSLHVFRLQIRVPSNDICAEFCPGALPCNLKHRRLATGNVQCVCSATYQIF